MVHSLSTLDFPKKFFLKGFNLKKKKGFIMRKKVFLHWQFQILELKKRFCFKKKGGGFHQLPPFLEAI